jgi:hypothetical protein
MPLQNRVTPFNELVAVPERGMFMGNRGNLHDDQRRIVRFAAVRRWICCRTEFKGRRRELMTPGLYTELFFMDEATALAAGHRPCFECRREDANRFRAAWAEGAGHAGALLVDDLDRALHDDRLERGNVMRRWHAAAASLPAGTMIATEAEALLLWDGHAFPWTPAGYGPAREWPAGTAEVLTSRSIVAALRAGYEPVVHPSAVRA